MRRMVYSSVKKVAFRVCIVCDLGLLFLFFRGLTVTRVALAHICLSTNCDGRLDFQVSRRRAAGSYGGSTASAATDDTSTIRI